MKLFKNTRQESSNIQQRHIDFSALAEIAIQSVVSTFEPFTRPTERQLEEQRLREIRENEQTGSTESNS